MNKNLTKTIICAFIAFSFIFTFNAYAQNSKDRRPPANQEENLRPHNKKEVLTNEERMAQIEKLYNEHRTLDNGTKDASRVKEIRQEILILLPDSLKEDVVQNLYERNGLFERAVKSALEKMEKIEKGYDEGKNFLGIPFIKIVN